MFIKTIKPEEQEKGYEIMFSKLMKRDSEVMNVSINADLCRKVKFSKSDIVDIFVDHKNKRIRIQRDNEGVKLCKSSEISLRTSYALKAGRLATKKEKVLIRKVSSGLGFVEFEFDDNFYIKRKAKKS